MKLQAKTSSFHTVFLLFLATLVVRAIEPAAVEKGCGPPLQIEQESTAEAATCCPAGQPQLSIGAWIRSTRVETMEAHFAETVRQCRECATVQGSHRSADQETTRRGRINEADLDFVVCALILWGLLSAFPS